MANTRPHFRFRKLAAPTSVSVNGAERISMTATCQVKRDDIGVLSWEQRQMVDNFVLQLRMLEGSPQALMHSIWSSESYGVTFFEGLNPEPQRNMGGTHMGTGSVRMNNGFFASEVLRGGPIHRLFVDGKLVTLVYQNGRVEMKPQNCLSADEQQLLSQQMAKRSTWNF